MQRACRQNLEGMACMHRLNFGEKNNTASALSSHLRSMVHITPMDMVHLPGLTASQRKPRDFGIWTRWHTERKVASTCSEITASLQRRLEMMRCIETIVRRSKMG
jgi:hypothetical protein